MQSLAKGETVHTVNRKSVHALAKNVQMGSTQPQQNQLRHVARGLTLNHDDYGV